MEAYLLPDWCFNKVLYVEKKGLLPVLQAASLAERYDMAIIAAEGYASRAAKALLAAAEGTGAVTVLVLHDADVDGYNISRTLREATAEVARLLDLDALAARRSEQAVATMDMAALHASVRDGLKDNPPEPWGDLTAQAAVATAALPGVRAAVAEALRSAPLA